MQSKLRAAKRAATKDASLQKLVADAEADVVTAVTAAEAATVDLDFPEATSGPERPATYWRRREVVEADARAAAAAHEAAAAKAAEHRAETFEQRARQAAQEQDEKPDADSRWFTAAGAAFRFQCSLCL